MHQESVQGVEEKNVRIHKGDGISFTIDYFFPEIYKRYLTERFMTDVKKGMQKSPLIKNDMESLRSSLKQIFSSNVDVWLNDDKFLDKRNKKLTVNQEDVLPPVRWLCRDLLKNKGVSLSFCDKAAGVMVRDDKILQAANKLWRAVDHTAKVYIADKLELE